MLRTKIKDDDVFNLVKVIKRFPYKYQLNPARIMVLIIRIFPEYFIYASILRKKYLRKKDVQFFAKLLMDAKHKGPEIKSIIDSLPSQVNLAIFIYIIYKNMDPHSKSLFNQRVGINIFCYYFCLSEKEQDEFNIYVICDIFPH